MRVCQLARCCKRRLDGFAEVDANPIARSPTRGQLCVTAFPATTFQNYLVFEKLRTHWRDPTQKLFGVTFVCLREMGPLPAKAGGGCGFVACYFVEARKPRDTASNGKAICGWMILG